MLPCDTQHLVTGEWQRKVLDLEATDEESELTTSCLQKSPRLQAENCTVFVDTTDLLAAPVRLLNCHIISQGHA